MHYFCDHHGIAEDLFGTERFPLHPHADVEDSLLVQTEDLFGAEPVHPNADVEGRSHFGCGHGMLRPLRRKSWMCTFMWSINSFEVVNAVTTFSHSFNLIEILLDKKGTCRQIQRYYAI
jgi:hypothetical protein